MVGKSREVVTNVVSFMEQTRQADFQELHEEFECSKNAIHDMIESWKRKISQNGNISNQFKRSKTEKDVEESIIEPMDKENQNPNVDVHAVAANSPHDERACDDAKETGASNGGDGKPEQPDYEKYDVNSLKVAQLRKLLKERGLDQQGLKRTLQLRLQRSFDEDREENQLKLERDAEQTAENNADVADDGLVEENNPDDMDKECRAIIEDAASVIHAERDMDEMNTKEPSIAQDASMEDVAFEGIPEEEDTVEPEPQVDHFIEAMVDAEDESGHISNVVDGNKVESSQLPKKEEMETNPTEATNKLPSPTEDSDSSLNEHGKGMGDEKDRDNVHDKSVTTPPTNGELTQSKGSQSKRGSMVCDMSVSEIANKRNGESNGSQISSTSSSAPARVPMSSSKTTSSQLGGMSTPALQMKKAGAPLSSSVAKAKKKQMDEARKARLEKIRSKVAQTQVSSLKPQPPVSVMKAKNTPSNDAAEERKRAIAAKMRQKAIAKKPISITSTPAPAAKPKMQPQQPKSTPIQPQQQLQHQQVIKNVRSPMDTYEMSDRGESDSDDSDYENHSTQKKVPKWAHKSNLIPALEKQFLDNPDRLDPDEIFPEVSTCDLGEIFDQKKKRYNKRSSTGNWTKDCVTASEKLVYKRRMGFQK